MSISFNFFFAFPFSLGSKRQIQGLGISPMVRQFSRDIIQESQRWIPTSSLEMHCRSEC